MTSIKKELRDRIALLGVDHPVVQKEFFSFLGAAFPGDAWVDFLLLKSTGKEAFMLDFLDSLPEPKLKKLAARKKEICPLILGEDTYFRTADIVRLCAVSSARPYAYALAERMLYGEKEISVLGVGEAICVLDHFAEYESIDLLKRNLK